MAGEIVLGYDGQPGSRAALRTAVSVAKAFERPLVIVFGYAPAAIGGEVSDLSRVVEEHGQHITEEAAREVAALDPTVEVRVELVNDRPADAILRACDSLEPIAVVIGAAGRGPVSGGLLGSVAYQLVHRSKCPVLVVPSNA